MVEEAEKHAEEDKLKMVKVEKRNELESYLYNVRNSIREEKVKETLGEDDIKKVDDLITSELSWLDDHSDEEAETYENKRKSVEQEVQPIMMKLYASQMPAGPKSEEVD
jgi:molecular chaperone DnaK (HSP70)